MTESSPFELSGTSFEKCDIHININGERDYYIPNRTSFAQHVDLFPGQNTITIVAKNDFTGIEASTAVNIMYVPSEDWEWKNVAIGKCGFITGIYIHPTEKDLIYLRTDVGGAYRYSTEAQGWIPLQDSTPYSRRTEYGIEAMALDPKNPDIVYMAAGMYLGESYPNGVLYKSYDRGNTWIALTSQFKMGGNESKTMSGERLVVDPFDSDVLYYGTRVQGLWKSVDGGVSWGRVEIPELDSSNQLGVGNILFDPARKGTIYINSYGCGIFKSIDDGATWTKLGGADSPKNVRCLALDSNGTLLATADVKKVLKFNGHVWMDISPVDTTIPDDQVFSSISTDPYDSLHYMVSVRPTAASFFQTKDGGITWRKISRENSIINSSVPWFRSSHWARGTSQVVFDPNYEDRVWFTSFHGSWKTDDISAEIVVWDQVSDGHEEASVMSVMTRTNTTDLLVGCADVGGFLIKADYDEYPDSTFNITTGVNLYNIWGMDFCNSSPDNVVAVGHRTKDSGYVIVSDNGGLSWNNTKSEYYNHTVMPHMVAMSSADPNTFIVTYQNEKPARTTDGGKTWTVVDSLPKSQNHIWIRTINIAADRVNGEKFYYYDYFTGDFYRSIDKGATFTKVNTLRHERKCYIHTSFENENELWVSLDYAGLYYSNDGGETFARVESIKRSYSLGLGRSEKTGNLDRLYVYGTIDKIEGLFYSDDRGASWYKISNEKNALGNNPSKIAGSKTGGSYVFVGQDGRGVFYGRRKEQ